jgi:hypothetical protein
MRAARRGRRGLAGKRGTACACICFGLEGRSADSTGGLHGGFLHLLWFSPCATERSSVLSSLVLLIFLLGVRENGGLSATYYVRYELYDTSMPYSKTACSTVAAELLPS